MRLPNNRTLLILLAVLAGAWLLLRSQSRLSTSQLPWNRGQAGSIFQGGQMGGGQ